MQTIGDRPRSGFTIVQKIITLYFGVASIAVGVILLLAGAVIAELRLVLLFVGVVMIGVGILDILIWQFVKRLPAPPSSGEVAQRTGDAATYMQNPWSPQGERSRIRSTGIAGQATVVDLKETGQRGLGGNPMIALGLEVTVPGQPKLRVVYTDSIAPIVLARLKPGTVLPCHVDAADPQKITVDY